MISSTHFSTTTLRVKHGGCEEYLHVPSFAQGIVFLSESFNFRIIKFL